MFKKLLFKICFLYFISYVGLLATESNINWERYGEHTDQKVYSIISDDNGEYYGIYFSAYTVFFKISNAEEYYKYYGNIDRIVNSHAYSIERYYLRFNPDYYSNVSYETYIKKIDLTTLKEEKWKVPVDEYLGENLKISPDEKKAIVFGDSILIFNLEKNEVINRFQSEFEKDGNNYNIDEIDFLSNNELVINLINETNSKAMLNICSLSDMSTIQEAQFPNDNKTKWKFKQTKNPNYILLYNTIDKKTIYSYNVSNNLYNSYELTDNFSIGNIVNIKDNSDEVIINTKIYSGFGIEPGTSYIYNFITNNIVYEANNDNLFTSEYACLNVNAYVKSMICAKTLMNYFNKCYVKNLNTNISTSCIFKEDNPIPSWYSNSILSTYTNKFSLNAELYNYDDGKLAYTSNDYFITKYNSNSYLTYNSEQNNYEMYDIDNNNKLDSVVLPDDYKIKSVSPHSKYILLCKNDDTRFLIRNQITKDSIIIANPNSINYNFLNDDYLYYYVANTWDTLYLIRISDKSKLKVQIPLKITFTADDNYIYYYNNDLEKLIRISFSDFTREELPIQMAIKNISISYDMKYILGITPLNTIIAYRTNNWAKSFEVWYQSMEPNTYAISDNNRYLLMNDLSGSAMVGFDLGILGIDEESDVSNCLGNQLFPNPANEIINLNIKDNLPIISIDIYNSNSVLVKHFENNYSNYININDLPIGSYWINIKYDKYSISKRFVKI